MSRRRGSGGRKRSRSRSRSKERRERNTNDLYYSGAGRKLKKPDWAQYKLIDFERDFHTEHPEISAMTPEEVDQWRKDHRMTVYGERVPRPIKYFDQAGFPTDLLEECSAAGFKRPTAIQSQGWPMALSGRDVVGIAETGSGKTVAFLLPAIVHITHQPLLRTGDGPIALIVAPTRELAQQIKLEADKFGYTSRLRTCCAYGGVSKRDQQNELRRGVEIVICTPGRLLDFLENKVTNLRRVTYLVLDEADRMLDLGFEAQIRIIVGQIRPDRQMLLWSATWNNSVEKLAKDLAFRKDFIKVHIGSLETSANKNVTQKIEVIKSHERDVRLFKILKKILIKDGKVMVFLATKRNADKMCRTLRLNGFPALSIHGDKSQEERNWVLTQFKSGQSPILLATDVASRGIHVDGVTDVVNYDFPKKLDNYVHRIGRCGRAGKKGKSHSFFLSDDHRLAPELISILERSGQKAPAELVRVAQDLRTRRY